jgi:hypothetical protein
VIREPSSNDTPLRFTGPAWTTGRAHCHSEVAIRESRCGGGRRRVWLVKSTVERGTWIAKSFSWMSVIVLDSETLALKMLDDPEGVPRGTSLVPVAVLGAG